MLSSPPSFGGRTSAEGLSSLLHQAGSSLHLLKQDRHLPPLHNNGDTRLSCGIGLAEGSGLIRASLVAQMVKNLPAMQVDLGSIPGSGRFSGGGNGTHFSILAWRTPWTQEPG